jgi:hypothetical protein
MTTTLEFNIVTAGLNGSNGLMRLHWSKRKKIKDKLTWLILSKSKARHPGKVRISYHRNYKSKPFDVIDNMPASLKFWADSIVAAGLIEDDSPDIIPETPVYTQSKGEPFTRIIIEDIL